jgi:hypothetical protein
MTIFCNRIYFPYFKKLRRKYDIEAHKGEHKKEKAGIFRLSP